jgi:Tfp pilus assembly protein PilP
MMASFLFWAATPGNTFSATDPGTGMAPESTRDAPADRSAQASGHKKFNPSGVKDPFKSFILDQEAPAGRKASKPRTYLETVDLSQLELIAVVLSPDDRWAMLRDAKGIGYVVKPGTPVGIDGGKVHQIRPGEIIIRTTYRNAKGETLQRDIPKQLVQ